jgi:copper transport protein
VVAPSGKRINVGDPVAAGNRMTIQVSATDRPLGTYIVSYRVISADSHPLAGAFAFSVGAPSATPPAVTNAGVHPVVAVAVPVAKYLGYAGLTLTIGPALMLAVLWPRRLTQHGPRRVVRAGLILLAAGTALSLWLQAPAASGAGPFDVSFVEFRQVVTSDFGILQLARLAVIAAAAALLGPALSLARSTARRAARAALVPLTVAGLLTWPLTGHQNASPQRFVSVAADVTHLLGMAIWLGGLVVVVAFLLRRADPRELNVILPVWSRWATVAVYWLVAAGVTQAVVEMGGFRQLIGTAYGELVLAKVALVAVVLAIAAYSRRLVNQRRGNGTPTVNRLRRSVFAELGVTMVILAVSSVLSHTTPARAAGIEAAAAAKAEGFVTTLNSPLYAVQFEIFPVQLGENNTLHAYVYTPDGRPLNVEEWTVTAALPDEGIEPMDNLVVTVAGNEGMGGINFPKRGSWKLSLTLRVSDIDQATVTTTVPVE